MKFSLAAMIRRVRKPRRKSIALREIAPPAVLATGLYRAFYAPVITAWQEAEARILAEYERTLAEMTTDSPADMDGTLRGIGELLERLLLTLTPRLRDWAVRLENWHRGKWRGAVLAAAGVDLQTMLGPEDVAETVEAFLARNAGLVRNVSEEARGRITDIVFRGLTARTPARDVAREIAEAIGMARRRALGIASDQLTKATSALDSERMRQAGIEEFIYRHSGKRHARPWHKARNGKRYNLDTLHEVDGDDVIEPNDAPGVPPFCACRKQAAISFD